MDYRRRLRNLKAVCLLSIITLFLRIRRKLRLRRRRRWGVHPLIRKRATCGEFALLYPDLRKYPDKFFSYYRMYPATFDDLVRRLRPLLQRNSRRKPISPEERLAVTLRYLATGTSLRALSFSFRLGHSTVCSIVHDTCAAICKVIGSEYLKAPGTPAQWESVASAFAEKWHFPLCVGALDGKHVLIQAPPNSGSQFFNYKGTFSLILLAACDANYCFTYVDIGSYGRESDGGVFGSSDLGKALENGSLRLPPPSFLPGTSVRIPHVFVADAAFPMKPNLMRPYPGHYLTYEKKAFNYRLSRARRIIENTFGILVARWRIFHRPIECHPDKVDVLIKAACSLHNYLKLNTGSVYCPSGFVDTDTARGHWRVNTGWSSAFTDISTVGGNRTAYAAQDVREELCKYFCSDLGKVEWQDKIVMKGS